MTVMFIKPHHFIDIITHYGAGTLTFDPHPYGHAVHTTAAKIMENTDILLVIELGADDICAPISTARFLHIAMLRGHGN